MSSSNRQDNFVFPGFGVGINKEGMAKRKRDWITLESEVAGAGFSVLRHDRP